MIIPYKKLFVEGFKYHSSQQTINDTNYKFVWQDPGVKFEAVIRVDKYAKLVMDRFNNFCNVYKNSNLKVKDITKKLNSDFSTFGIDFILQYFQDEDHRNIGINKMITGIRYHNGIVGITIFINPLIKDNINNQEMLQVFETLIKHELIHKGQFLKIRNKDLRLRVLQNQQKTKEYLARPFEIMAYANSYIEELRFGGYSDSEILNTIKYNREGVSGILDKYIELFKETNMEILNKFYKYVYEYLKG